MAITINGLYKTQVIRYRGPWKSIEEVEYATMDWVDWFNHRHVLEAIGYVSLVEYEIRDYASIQESAKAT